MRRLLCSVAVLATLLVPAAGRTTLAAPALAVDGGADRHPISPQIYGLSFADAARAAELGLPVDRWGGNQTDTYNWRLHGSNTGNDWFFENIPDCWDDAHGWCSSGSVNGAVEFVDKDRTVGAKTLLTLPMMGYVAKDARLGHPFTCGFPASVFPNQDAFDPYDPNCGNGLLSGAELPSDPARDGKPIKPPFDAAWIADLVSRYGEAASGGVAYYELGNEPALWNSTHRDMHPAPETYDELWQKSRDLALAVRAADPTADVVAFSEWGWPNYFCSAADDVSHGCSAASPDRAKHGGVPLVNWFLRKMRSYEQAHGERLIDYLDVHYYAQGGNTTDVTRSLWDPTYEDPSWIGAKIRLIPRMRQWVAKDYPGTKISLSEYNLSVADPVTNALIQADVLGIFAREGLDLATRWGMGNDGGLTDDAYRLYRNYDGEHGRFGDTWVRSTSTDQARLAVYAAQRTSDDAYTIVVINKGDRSLRSPLSLAGMTVGPAAEAWRWTGNGISRIADQPVAPGGFTATYPGRSLTLFVLPAA
jgi:hypothetical protein